MLHHSEWSTPDDMSERHDLNLQTVDFATCNFPTRHMCKAYMSRRSDVRSKHTMQEVPKNCGNILTMTWSLHSESRVMFRNYFES